MAARDMGDFWDRRARENPLFFVDNSLDYNAPDEQAFWADGRRWLDELLGSLGGELSERDAVVEIGCGVGRLTRPIAERAASVVALDVSTEMLARAREHNRHLENVEWVHGDGTSLAGVPDAEADVCLSHVVFQHIPDPRVTLGYIREIGRVLRPGGWAAFQVSNDRRIHRRRRGRERARMVLDAARGRAPRGQANPNWLGSAVDLEDVRAAAGDGAMQVQRIAGEGTQLCYVLTRRC